MGKIFRAREFLAQSRFDLGVARIPLRTLQELRGKAEHWSLCNRALGPELHVIDKIFRSKQGHSAPKGDSAAAKQIYFEFRETMKICWKPRKKERRKKGIANSSTIIKKISLYSAKNLIHLPLVLGERILFFLSTLRTPGGRPQSSANS